MTFPKVKTESRCRSRHPCHVGRLCLPKYSWRVRWCAALKCMREKTSRKFMQTFIVEFLGKSWNDLVLFGNGRIKKVYGAKVSSLQLPCGNLRTSLASAEWLGNPNAENFQSFLEKWNYFRHVCTCCPKTIQASKASNGSNGARSEFVPVFGPGLSPAIFACRWQVWKIRKQDIARAPWKNIVRTHSPSRFLIVCCFKDFEQLCQPEECILSLAIVSCQMVSSSMAHSCVLRIFGFDDQRRCAQNLPAEICSNELHQALSSGEGWSKTQAFSYFFNCFSVVSAVMKFCRKKVSWKLRRPWCLLSDVLPHKWLAVRASCFPAASEPAPKECNRRRCLCQALHYQTQWARHGFATRHTKFQTVSNEFSCFHLCFWNMFHAVPWCSMYLSLRYMRIAPELYLKQPLSSQIQKTKWHIVTHYSAIQP